MGGNVSKQETESSILNQVMVESMTRNSTTLSASVDQSNDLLIAGNTEKVTISGITQVNASKINVTALLKAVQSATLQADLVNKLTAKVDQTMPTLAVASDSTQSTKTIISNVISSKITTENFQNIAAQVKSSNTIKVVGNAGVDIRDITQKNEATLIMGLVADTTTSIVASLKATSTAEIDASQKPAALFDFSFGVIFIIIIIVILGGVLYYFKSTGLAVGEILAKPQVIALIALILGFFAYEAISAPAKK